MPDVRTPLISGNWKMNLDHFEALRNLQKLAWLLPKDIYQRADVSIHPPFTDIRTLQTSIEADRMDILLGAQHCHHEVNGAFTGEVSPLFLQKLDVKLVICGHSERRDLFGETDEMVNAKVKAILKHNMTPIMCVGESLAEREAGETEAKVLGQVVNGLQGVKKAEVGSMV
ncbi:MAG: triose-phosphate isomerase, partial [Ilumatobacteraceae bacterium]